MGHTETFADIAVNDGSVTIELIEGVDNPTIAGFAIFSNDGELDTTEAAPPRFLQVLSLHSEIH